MPATFLLLQLLGQVALLLWGIHMVHTGVSRAYGSDLRRVLAKGLGNRVRALLAGLGVTALLQSSTATAMMATTFTAGGMVALVPALAIMLGANIGTTLIVQVLSFEIALLYPLFILAGLIAFRQGDGTRWRDLGRVAIGLGLILLSLDLLTATLEPLDESAAFQAVFAVATADPVITLLLTAVVAWLAHSSIAAMLLVISLAGGGLLTAEAIIAMVLGANLGSAVNPLIAAMGHDRAALRVPLGNLLNRAVGCVAVLVFLGPLSSLLAGLAPSEVRLAVDFHTGFNLVMALVFILPLPWVARLMEWLLPESPRSADPAAPQYLDETALDTPTVALSNAARETLRMVDVLDEMLRGCRELLHRDDRDKVAEISRMDDVLDSLHGAIQRYLNRLDDDAMTEDEARRASEILSFAINLEHAGDIVDKNLMELIAKRIRANLSLSEEGLAEIDDLMRRLIEHLKLAVAVFMFGDTGAARRLVAGKDRFRDLERATTQSHFGRVRGGRAESIETSGLHLDLVRDLKRVESHIAATAYPLLEESGDLKPSRLVG